MIVSLSHQSMVFLLFIALGIAFGAIYDILRAFRRVFDYKAWLIHTQDIIFWIFAAFATFYIILLANYGEVRAFIILGIILGVILYFAAFSYFIIKIFIRIIKWIKKTVETVIKIILSPFILIAKFFLKIFNFGKKYARIIKRKFKKPNISEN